MPAILAPTYLNRPKVDCPYYDELLREPRLMVPRMAPVGSTRINWSHPLSENLVGCWLVLGNNMVDLVYGNSAKPTLNSYASFYTKHGNMMLGANTDASIGTIAYASKYFPTAAITVVCTGLFPSDFPVLGCDRDASFGFGLGYAGSANMYLRVGSSWADKSCAGPAAGSFSEYGFAFDGSQFRAFSNGVVMNTQTISGTISYNGYDIYLNGNGGSGQSLSAASSLIRIYKEGWTAAEIQASWNDPYQFLIPA